MTRKMAGSETEEEILKLTSQDNFKLVASSLRGECHDVLTFDEQISVWLLADGFGPQDLNGLNTIEMDWSHVRDSSPRAQADMAQKVRDILANRAHPGHQFCVKCLDSGLHMPEVI